MRACRWLLPVVVALVSWPGAAGGQSAELRDATRQSVQAYREDRLEDAIGFAATAVAISEREYGPKHLATAGRINNLALLYYRHGNYTMAEPLLELSLDIREKALGPDNLLVANAHSNLAELYRAQEKHDLAESLHRRALRVRERELGPDHPVVAQSLSNLALVYFADARYRDAEPLLKRSLAIFEKTRGPNHVSVAKALETYAALLSATGRDSVARQFRIRASQIRAQAADNSQQR